MSSTSTSNSPSFLDNVNSQIVATELLPEAFDFAVDILQHRLFHVVFEWIPPNYSPDFVKTIDTEVRTAIKQCVAYPSPLYMDVKVAIYRKLAFDMSETEVLRLVLIIYDKGVGLMLKSKKSLNFLDLFSLIYWASGMVCFLRFSPHNNSAIRLTTILLSCSLERIERRMSLHLRGWDGLKTLCEDLLLIPRSQNTYFALMDDLLTSYFEQQTY